MLEKLQKYAPTISILLLVALLVALLFAPNAAQILSTAIILFGIGTAVFFTVQGNRERKEENDLSQSEFFRNTFLDLLGLALVTCAPKGYGLGDVARSHGRRIYRSKMGLARGYLDRHGGRIRSRLFRAKGLGASRRAAESLTANRREVVQKHKH